MDSKRQSKLPDGLGKKILQALKTQDEGSGESIQETSFNNYEESGQSSQNFQPAMDEHGLETISHMDFGAQEMQFDQQPLHSEFSELDTTSEVINLDSGADANGAHYGSFMESSQAGFETPTEDPFAQDDFGTPAVDVFAQDNFNQAEFETPAFQEDPFSSQKEDSTDYEQVDYNQQSYDEFDYNQQSYDDFDFSQDSYGEVSESFEPEADSEETISSYQQPILGEAPAQQTEQAFEQQYEEPDDQAFESYSQEPETNLDNEFDFSASIQHQQAGTQIGYSTQDIASDDSYDQQWQEPVHQEVGIDLDAIEVQKPDQEQYQEVSKSPLDLDQIDPNEPKMPQAPPKTQQHEVHTRYQEPVAMEEKYYQQPAQNMYTQEEYSQESYYGQQGSYYQEPHRDMYQQPQANRYYQDPHRDMYQQPQQDRFYQEPHREIYQQPQADRFYQQPQVDRFYQEPHRDLNRQPMDMQRMPEAPMQNGERYSSNVETLMRLVANLPNGVPKQTGAQIIRQTMEAMGIPISEVIAEAQQTQGRMLNKTKENYTAIDEHKMQIRRLEDSIYMHQRKAKELDDIINLFIGSNQMRMHH